MVQSTHTPVPCDDMALKEKGNSFFKDFNFTEAETCYSIAIESLLEEPPGEENGSTDGGSRTFRRAVCYSNRSNCRFELAKYKESISDAETCLAILKNEHGTASISSLVDRNLLRIARALIYNQSADAAENTKIVKKAKENLGKILETSQDKKNIQKAADMLEALSFYDSIASDPNKMDGSHYFTRPNLGSPYREYYRFGHDRVESALTFQCKDPDFGRAQSIRFSDLSDDQLSSLSFLYGGVGDGRHVFATLLDAHKQFRTDLTPERRELLQMSLTLNDVSRQAILKDILCLVLSFRLGECAPESFDAAKHNEEAAGLSLVILYATLGYVMPPFVYDSLIRYINEIFLTSSREEFSQTYPWILIDETTWQELVQLAEIWANAETMYEPPLPSASHTLKSFYAPDSIETLRDRTGSDIQKLGSTEEWKQNMDQEVKRSSPKLDFAEKIITMVQNKSLWTKETKQFIENALGPDPADDELAGFLVFEFGSEEDHDSLVRVNEVLKPDKIFHSITHAIWPPFEIMKPLEEMRMVESLELTQLPPFESEFREAAETFKSHVQKTWRVNPVMFDPDWYRYNGGDSSSDNANRIIAWIEMFYETTTQELFCDPPLNTYEKLLLNTQFGTQVCCFYWNLGKALNDLRSHIRLEIAVGDIVGFVLAAKTSAKDREMLGSPNKYARIYLSNIPDYIGLLSAFVGCLPLLDQNSQSFLRHNILLNTGIWGNFDEYVLSTMGLTRDGVERIFRLTTLQEDPSPWDMSTMWTWQDNEPESGVTFAEVRTWLHRLYLMTAVPQDRNIHTMIREERSNTTALFLNTCSLIVDVLGYPTHWVASVLDELLQSSDTECLKTKASIINTSPSPVPSERKIQKHNITAFRLELENQVSMWLQDRSLPQVLLSTKSLPKGSARRYRVTFDSVRENGYVSFNSLGFILEASFDSQGAKEDDRSETMMQMMQMMCGMNGSLSMPPPKPSKMRQDILGRGSKVGHVFSSCKWDYEQKSLEFWMCEDSFGAYQDHHVSLIRTDSWMRLCTTRLSKATMVLHDK